MDKRWFHLHRMHKKIKGMEIMFFLFIVAFFLEFLDIRLTYQGLKSFIGKFYDETLITEDNVYMLEGNLYARSVIKIFGLNGLVLIAILETSSLLLIFALPSTTKNEFLLKLVIFSMVILAHLNGVISWLELLNV